MPVGGNRPDGKPWQAGVPGGGQPKPTSTPKPGGKKPAWRTSSWSGTHPNGNCVQVAPAGVCNCGGDPNCRVCGGNGTVWIRGGVQ